MWVDEIILDVAKDLYHVLRYLNFDVDDYTTALSDLAQKIRLTMH